MLKNAYLLAKIDADTAENEQHFAENLPIGRRVTAAGRRGRRAAPRDAARRGRRVPALGAVGRKLQVRVFSFLVTH